MRFHSVSASVLAFDQTRSSCSSRLTVVIPRLLIRLTCKFVLAYSRRVADVFKALADPTRRAILDELRDRNDQTLFELCTRLTMKHGLGSSRQAISQHLDVLEEAGLVTTSREGRYKFHRLDTSPLRAIVERWPINDGR